MVLNVAIPMQVAAFYDIQDGKWFPGVVIIMFFIIYPIVTYVYIKVNLDKIEGKNENDLFKKMHKAAFSSIRYYRVNRLGLGYNFFPQYRRLS